VYAVYVFTSVKTTFRVWLLVHGCRGKKSGIGEKIEEKIIGRKKGGLG
jgi:hypothetical protein